MSANMNVSWADKCPRIPQGVPSPGLSIKCPHYCRVYAQGAAVTGAVGRWWRGITRTGQLSGCTAVTDNHRCFFVFHPLSLISKFNYLDINFSIVKVASYLMLYLIWDLYLQPSSAPINPVQPCQLVIPTFLIRIQRNMGLSYAAVGQSWWYQVFIFYFNLD